ncbi:ATP-dependent 6-phosphofructokinase [Thermosynechococcaceae cyanobacterium BACA0444]|uniref:ATP-dependent 6-phosphofructokinase n=1 Tax=Pseudocalidococcus azoricus BACA0444 TaxID=2918990 RepID=A0AAE4JYI1_9CYAN|nr:ATP-dependent 6-phosphofructokinase [Pseudocalidococcus azoricus]MDS3859737.1 ATP-dependent 6-phosphofructokinase [Pseudocalidococcus azoricus BACA0444]
MAAQKRIGILTSGGDCAGLNAAIRAVVHHAIGTYGWEVIGIQEATHGLMHRPPKSTRLDIEGIDQLLLQGGTILGTTNKGNPFAFPMAGGTFQDRSAEIIAGYHELKLDALVGIGGDGSLAILRRIANQGNLNLVAIPKTIDNDVGATELSIGFDTATNIATEALDRLHFTAASHSRVMVLEVMGRDAGHIALSAGIAGGADIILIPEIPYNLDNVAEKIRQRQAQGKKFCLVMVSEAVRTELGDQVTQISQQGEDRYGGIGKYIAEQIATRTGAESRVTVLGHIQRGGIPSPADRLLGTVFGVAAVNLIAEEKYDHMVAWKNREVVSVPIAEAIKTYRNVDLHGTLIKTARGMGICLGDDY